MPLRRSGVLMGVLIVGAAIGLLLQFVGRPLNRHLDQRVADKAHK
jgi:hypothetical protein